MKKHAFDLVLFDLDGTLVDSRQDLAQAVNHALAALGQPPLSVDMITSYVGDGISKLLQRSMKNLSNDELQRGRQAFREYYAEHVADFTRPYDGVPEMLAHFRDKKKALLTNKDQTFTESLLQQLDLGRFFDAVVGGNSGFEVKPDPEALLSILQKLGVLATKALMIGDSSNDILAGKNAGVATCAVTWGYRPEAELAALQPDLIVHKPEEIIDLVA